MRDQLIALFPRLDKDPHFKITSPCTHEYNCIAWAALRNNIFWWPHQNVAILDGVEWPFGLPLNSSLSNFISLYYHLEYEVCSSWKFENGLQKIALYVDQSNSQVTHAARQNFDGIWTSKLGSLQDILHTNPHSLEDSNYGLVTTIMSRKNSSYNASKVKKGVELL
jgi:hypothetical protein